MGDAPTSKARWRVSVQGPVLALDTACETFRNGDIIFVRDGATTYVETQRFDDLDDASAVLARAAGLLDVVSGVLQTMGVRGRLTSGNVAVDQRPGGSLHVRVENRATIETRVSVRSTNPDGTVASQEPEDSARAALARTAGDEAISSLLALVGKGVDTWVDLYRIHERLEALADGLVQKGLCSKAELDRFKQTANSRDAVGDDARHGASKVPPPSQPMTIDEARRLVLRMVRAFLRSTGRQQGS